MEVDLNFDFKTSNLAPLYSNFNIIVLSAAML
jgi:hypothetical protein